MSFKNATCRNELEMLPGVMKLMLELSTHNRTVRVTAGLEFRMHIERPENAFGCFKYESQ